MKKYVMTYDDQGGSVDMRFFQSDKDFEAEGITLGQSIWGDFVDEDLVEFLNKTFGIEFSEGDTFILDEIPEVFETI